MPTKIFVGRIAEGTSSDELRALFRKYGKVVECDVITNFGFVVRYAGRWYLNFVIKCVHSIETLMTTMHTETYFINSYRCLFMYSIGLMAYGKQLQLLLFVA